MPMLVQICVVIVSLAIVATLVTTIIAMIRLGATVARLTAATETSMVHVDRIVRDTQELVASVREIVPPARRVVTSFQRLGERAADLSNAVLDEIEPPILTAVAVARGVKTGTGHLVDLLTRRFVSRSSSHNGDKDHV